jgi:hypothetical protein
MSRFPSGAFVIQTHDGPFNGSHNDSALNEKLTKPIWVESNQFSICIKSIGDQAESSSPNSFLGQIWHTPHPSSPNFRKSFCTGGMKSEQKDERTSRSESKVDSFI